MGMILRSFGEHVVRAAALEDGHVFEPIFGIKRIGGVADPGEPVGRRGVPQKLLAIVVAVVTAEPQMPAIALAHDPASFANFDIPVARSFGGEHGIFCVGREMNQLRWKLGSGCRLLATAGSD